MGVESLVDVPKIDPAARIGFIALALEQIPPFFVAKDGKRRPSRKIPLLTDELITSLREALGVDQLADQQTPNYAESLLTELTLMSLGYMESESAQMQGIELKEVKNRKRRAKEIIGAPTKSTIVIESIQRGLIIPDMDPNPDYQLSPIEDCVLHLTASGVSAQEIGLKYGLKENSIEKLFGDISHKLKARNMVHTLRRAFELGIFEVGKSIHNPDKEYEDLQIYLGETVLNPRDIGIIHPNELEIVKRIGIFGQSSFVNQDILNLGQGTKNNLELDDRAFGQMMFRIMEKLEKAAGQPVLTGRKGRVGKRRPRLFVFNLPTGIGKEGKVKSIPAHVRTVRKTAAKPGSRIKKHFTKPPKSIQPKKTVRKVTPQPKAKPVVEPAVTKEEPKNDLTPQEARSRKPLSNHLRDVERAMSLVGIRPLSVLKEDRDELLQHVDINPELGYLVMAIENQIAVLEERT